MIRINNKSNPELKFEYINWKGEKAVRTVRPIEIWYGSTEWHKEEQWFLKAVDTQKQAERDFAVKDIIKFL